MDKHTQTIHRLLPTNCLNVFDHFLGLALKGLILKKEATTPIFHFKIKTAEVTRRQIRKRDSTIK